MMKVIQMKDLNIEGKVMYKAKLTEEITKHIATNPT